MIRPEHLDLLLPGRPEPADTWRWGTITQASPLRVRLDGDSTALDVTPDTLTVGLLVGDRVWCQVHGRRVITQGQTALSGPVQRVYTASGTWTKPAGLLAVTVECQGGGGGGGGRSNGGAGTASVGGGGGGGGYARATIPASALPTSVAITVGAGGPGVTGGAGQTGQQSRFGNLVAGNGGAGGAIVTDTNTVVFSVAGGNGGGASSGSVPGLAIPGQTGGAGRWTATGTAGAKSGDGGDSVLGMGGGVPGGTTGTARDGSGYGGGGGGNLGSAQADGAGGDGAPGVVIVTEHYR